MPPRSCTVVLLTLSCLISASQTSSVKCPASIANCSCNSVRISCDLKGYTTIPDIVVDDTLSIRDISITDNNLTEINDDHFRNFIHLNWISLRNNQILTISENAFHHNSMLHTIYLSHNRLKSIPTELFQPLALLEDVYLENNQLQVIESAHFHGLVNLKRVRLQDNQLTSIGSEAFISSVSLSELYLESNRLETPERNWLLHFDHTKSSNYELYMDDNPWSCDCRMKEFYDWAITKNWFIHASSRETVSIPKCHKPEQLRGKLLSSINSPSQLKCSGLNLTTRTKALNVVEGHQLEIPCAADGFPKPIVTVIDPSGSILISGAGQATFVKKAASAGDSGKYYCNASVSDSVSSKISEQAVSITVTVQKDPSSAVSVGMLCVLATAVLMGAAVWYYKRYRPTSAYGRLPNDPQAADKTTTASYTTKNAESMKVSLSRSSGTTPYHSAITSHLSRGEDDEDDDITEYHKDTEFLV